MDRAYSLLNIKSVDQEKRIIRGTATTPTPDRMGDVVNPMGVKYNNPLPMLWQHQSGQPVGSVKFSKPTKDGIDFEAQLAAPVVSQTLRDRVDEAWESVTLGLVRSVSIGFKPIKYAFMDDGGIEFQESEVLELSLVTIPANAEATISQFKSFDSSMRKGQFIPVDDLNKAIEAIKAIDAPLLAASGKEPKASDRPTHPASGKKSLPVTSAQPGKGSKVAKKSVTEQISDYTNQRAVKAARLETIMEGATERGETLNPQEQEEYEEISGTIKAIDSHLVRLEEMKAFSVANVKDVDGSSSGAASVSRVVPGAVKLPPTVKLENAVKLEPGIKFARFVRAMAISKGVPSEAIEVVKNNPQWMNETPELVQLIRSAQNPGTTTDSAWAGPLVNYQVLASEFAAFLRPLTIIGRIPGLRYVPFNVKVQRQTAASSVNWVGEGAPKPLSQLAFDLVSLTYSKIAGIVTITDELAKLSNPSADALVRDDLRDAIVQFMDAQFVDPSKAAVSGISPASITNGVTPVTSTGTTAAALRADLLTLMQAFLAQNLSLADAVFIMTQQQAAAISLMVTSLGVNLFPGITAQGGTLVGLPVITSENIPGTGGSPADGGLILLVKASEIMIADDGQVTIDASNQASLQMESAPDSPATASTIMVSMFQQNMIAIRAERYINWVKRRSAAVQFIQNAKYTG